MTNLKDVQALLLSGFGKLPHARFLLLGFGESDAARRWIGEIASDVRTAADGAPDSGTALQVAFSFAGFERLQLSWQALNGFSREFREGMAGSERRSRILGDTQANAPEHWQWGGPQNTPVHGLLLLYAQSQPQLDALSDAQVARAEAAGITVIRTLDTSILPESKEHFGFRDGISQPKMRQFSSSTDERQLVTQGEFMLGYPNERDEYTMRPMVDPIEDPGNHLDSVAEDSDLRDLGKHGSYLVIRQLSQDVESFWSWVRSAAAGEQRAGTGPEAPPASEPNPDPGAVALAAKMVGRWPGGAPLAVSDHDDENLATENDFGYHHIDRHGTRCPIGAHVRRTNPRDSLAPGPGTDKSLEINRRHRLLRRGRPYGEPLTADLALPGLMRAADDGRERGLQFLCLNADISRQFEFVQHTWANNPNFAGLSGETDPLIGVRPEGADRFTCPAEPVRSRHHGLPRFVGVRGGAYLFVPSMATLRYLSSVPRALTSRYSAPAPPAIILEDTVWSGIARAANAVLERLISMTRRFTLARNAFDSLFQKLMTGLVQKLMMRRRLKQRIDADLEIAEERLVPGEALIAQQITRQMAAFQLRHYRNSTAERAGNTKTYGLLEATFEVPELPEALRVGIFRSPRSYRAWVRFGGPGPLATPDIRNNGVLSIGMKLLDVDGQTLLDDEQHTQDFSGISAPTFTTPDVAENLKLQQYIGADMATGYFLNPFDSHYLDMLMQGMYAKAHGCPFETSYWSCVPYLYGAGRAYKYRFAPRSPNRTRVPIPAPDNYLRQAMRRTLAERDVVQFDFLIQFQEDPVRMPIEDASIIWSSEEVAVATLSIPAQSFATPERDLMARELTINPWHAIPEHRPLGNQNRARRTVYYETSRIRQRINNESHKVPGSTLEEEEP